MEKKHFDVEEAAAYLKERLTLGRGFTKSCLRRKAASGEIHSGKIDGVRVFHVDVLEAIVKRQNRLIQELNRKSEEWISSQ